MELFGTAGIRGDARKRVTPELALAVGRAAGQDGRDGQEFVVGRDGRTTGPALAAAVEAGLESAGARVVRAGPVPTPALAFATRNRRGLMVTASHNPPTDNGLKLFHDGREYDREAERRIEERVDAEPAPARWDQWATSETTDPMPEYIEAVVAYGRRVGSSLAGLRVAVDCGNGTASLATPAVLRELGADVAALNANVDGHFPARDPKPTPESIADLRAFVGGGGSPTGPDGFQDGGPDGFQDGGPDGLQDGGPVGLQDGGPDGTGDAGRDATGDAGGYDLGMAHDGDGDRVVFVDSTGNIVHEDTVIAIIAERFVRESDPGDPVVVTTPNASGRIDDRVEAAGGRVERVRLGALHEGIASARREGTDETAVVYAAEPWKHLHPALGPWIDGVATAAVFARLVAEEGLEALRTPVRERPYRKESVPCPDEGKDGAMAVLEGTLPGAFPDADVSTDYGVRLSWADGSWALVRPSGTEPYLRVYAESDAVDDLVERVLGVVGDAVGSDPGD